MIKLFCCWAVIIKSSYRHQAKASIHPAGGDTSEFLLGSVVGNTRQELAATLRLFLTVSDLFSLLLRILLFEIIHSSPQNQKTNGARSPAVGVPQATMASSSIINIQRDSR